MLRGWIAYSNIPSVKVMAAMSAWVLTLTAKSFTFMLLYALDHAFDLKVLKVNTASSRNTTGIFYALALSRSSTMLMNHVLY